jgi:hypothetical protein
MYAYICQPQIMLIMYLPFCLLIMLNNISCLPSHFCVPVDASVCLSVCLFVSLSVSVYLLVYLSVFFSVCLFLCLSICLSACLSICLSVYLSVYLFVCLSICLFLMIIFISGMFHYKSITTRSVLSSFSPNSYKYNKHILIVKRSSVWSSYHRLYVYVQLL